MWFFFCEWIMFNFVKVVFVCFCVFELEEEEVEIYCCIVVNIYVLCVVRCDF